MLFYYDQRIRKEGFDIEWMMQRAGLVGVPAAVPADVAVALSTAPESISAPNDSHTAVGESS
jgi:hypothetical protein